MNSESVPKLCPRCCGPVPADAPQGLCPRCVLAQAAAPAEMGARSGARLTPPPLEAVATAFPQFEILELIGVGGMGVVYKARQPKLDRIVALKLLPQSPSADPAFAERFHREARFLARLTHPHIVSVFDFGESGGFCFLLMEFVDGVNLRQAMQAGRFSPAQALAIVPDICAALQFAHNQGVLHRDIKPENILLDAQGRVKIADFGIAKLVGDPGDPRTDLALTQSGARLGTPHYMAPEQIEQPSDVDHRADIYSLGVVFYELLTGELPLGRFAAPSAKTPLDARVDDIVMRALAKERELRQQSAGEMKTQVETVAANPQAPAADPAASAIQAARDTQEAARSAAASWPANYEYKSPRTVFGRPLVHIAYGTDPVTGKARVARGIIALGQKAIGVVAIGGYARGLIAIGGVAVGGIAFGGLGLGLFVIAGLALGLVSVGGLSIGLLLALGGGALGLNAGGGVAIGKFAAGGLAFGKAIWDARHHDEAAEWIIRIIQAPLFSLALLAFSMAAAIIPAAVGGWVQWRRHRGLAWASTQPPGAPTPVLKARRIGPWIFLGLLIVLMLAATLPLFLLIPSKTPPKFENSAEAAMMRNAPYWLTYSLVKSGGSELLVEYRFGCLRQTFLTIEGNAFRQSARLLPAPPSTNGAWVHPFEGRVWLRLTPTLDGQGTYVDFTTAGADGSPVSKQQILNIRFPELARGVLHQLPPQGRIPGEREVLMAYTSGLRLKGTLTEFPEPAPATGVSPTTTAAVSRVPQTGTNLPTLAPAASRMAALELQAAQNRLAEAKKMAEVGVIAPQGKEILDLEVAVAEAEAKLKGDPRIGALARLKRAEILCISILQRIKVGAGTTAELEQEQLEQAKLRTALAETLRQGTTNAAELKWLTAWSQFSEEQVKSRTGRTSPAQFILALRNLTVSEAELLHQPLWAAQAWEAYRQGILEIKLREFADGQVSQAEVDTAKQLLKQAEDERGEVEKANSPAPSVVPGGTGKVEPAPSGEAQAKADFPQPAVPSEPAKPVTDYSGQVRFYGAVNGKIELPAKHPTRLTDAIMDLGQDLGLADLKKVKVQHTDGSFVVVNVDRMRKENTREQDLILRDGDRVEIHDKTFNPLP